VTGTIGASPWTPQNFAPHNPATLALRPRTVFSTSPAVARCRGQPHVRLDLISVLEATPADDPRPIPPPRAVFMARGEAGRGGAKASVKASNTTSAWNCSKRSPWPKPPRRAARRRVPDLSRVPAPVGDFELSPKSVVRTCNERAMTFNDYIGFLAAEPL
jgi:hypothetical protein